jgi:hypothetical protein
MPPDASAALVASVLAQPTSPMLAGLLGGFLASVLHLYRAYASEEVMRAITLAGDAAVLVSCDGRMAMQAGRSALPSPPPPPLPLTFPHVLRPAWKPAPCPSR